MKSRPALEESQNQITPQHTQLAAQESDLEAQASTLAEQESTLAEQAASLTALQALLEQQKLTLAEKESEVDAQNLLLDQKESELAASQTKLDDANKLMADQQARIDQIIGVKADLIEDLNAEFQKNQISVQIDKETGAILLNSSVLFEFSESYLTEEGGAILQQVLPVYCGVLLSEDYVDYMAEIIIEGYTDSVGDYTTNLTLSQSRAYAVAQYLLTSMGNYLSEDKQQILMSKLTANGRSSSNPILDENGQEDADASRRVEIKFRLKDEEMIDELQSIIEESRKKQEEVE